MIPTELQTLWDEARHVMPEWPGFLRLSLDAQQMDSLDGCAEELDDVMGAIRKDFPHITTVDEGGGLGSFTARRDPAVQRPVMPDSPPARPWWQLWKRR
jgi:hypothetical protein